MLSSCSNGGLSHEMSVYSMWRDATQMLSGATAHHRRVTRMRQRMATWLQEGSSAQSTELQYLRLARSGLELSWQSLEKSFLLLSRSWILGHFAVHSDLYELTPTGSTDPLLIRTSLPMGFLSTRQKYHSLMTGYNETWRDLLLVSDSIALHSLRSWGSLEGNRSLLGLFANVVLGSAWSDPPPALGPLQDQSLC